MRRRRALLRAVSSGLAAALLFSPFLSPLPLASADPLAPEQEESEARARIEGLALWADTLLADDTLSPDQARDAFSDIVDESFDIQRIARFVLGRYWRQAVPADRQAFEGLVRREIVNGFGRNLSYFRGRRLIIEDSVWRRAGDVDVLTGVSSPGLPAIPVTFRLQRQDQTATLRIIDIQVMGFSLITAQRQAVESRVQANGGVSALLLDLSPDP